MKIKIKTHTFLNRLAFWVLFPIFAIGAFFIYRDAANATLRIVGLALLALLLIGCLYLFIFKLCVYDYAIFNDKGIELHTPFKLKVFYKYSEVNACLAEYTSIIESKKYLTFTSKKFNSVVTHIDTSTNGNIIAINKMKVVYAPMTKELFDFLKEQADLQWYINK